MSLALLVAIGVLTSVGVFLISSRSLSRLILGFSLIGHATVLSLLVAGGPPGPPPFGASGAVANPLPQALGLTAIVITFGLTLFLLALGVRQQDLTGDDLVEDDIEDRRIRTRVSDEERRADEDHGGDDIPDGSGPGEEQVVA